MLMQQQTVTNSAVIHGLCAMTLNQPLLAQARPRMINHLTSTNCSSVTLLVTIYSLTPLMKVLLFIYGMAAVVIIQL